MQAIDTICELAIGIVFLTGAYSARLRTLLFGVGTAGLVLLFGGFLVISFTFSGDPDPALAAVGIWYSKYPVMIAIAVGLYIGIEIASHLVTRVADER